MNTQQQRDSPFFRSWTSPGEAPPFEEIRPEHFAPAYARAFAEHEAEVAVNASRAEPPDFTNTIAALELSGRMLARVEQVFHLLAGAHSNDALLAIERELAPQIARHWHNFHTEPALFRRIDALMRQADTLGLSAEQKRVLERYHTTFRRAGAALDEIGRAHV